MISPATSVIQGSARITDGDTLVIGDQRIRLFGVDAPESKQLCKDAKGSDYACGLTAKQALVDKVASQAVRCEVKNMDQYGRFVAACSVPGSGGSQDLGAHMASNGMAVAYRQYSNEYIPLEEAARAARKGIWQGSFQVPAEWRKQSKASPGSSTAPPCSNHGLAEGPSLAHPCATLHHRCAPADLLQPCAGHQGEHRQGGGQGELHRQVYHVPGGQYYDAVKIDTSKGERMFCSEEEAVKAGWHAAKK
ncbi:MAG: hypothetical protein WDW38_004164 [Sanguina aurantia]